MSDLTLNCNACGNIAHLAHGYVDLFDNVFCTKECYHQIGQTTHCVSRFDLSEELDKPDLTNNPFYTCDTLQLATQSLAVGEKIEHATIAGKPKINATQTMAMWVRRGEATVYVYQNDVPWPMIVTPRGDEKDMIVIPPGTPHIIENTGAIPLLFFAIYSPPVLATCL